MTDKLTALAAEIDRRNNVPADWSTLLRYATISELSALGAADRERPEHRDALEEIRRRCQQRYRIGLKVLEAGCFAKRPNPACNCGEQALETLSADDLAKLGPAEAKERLRKLAAPHHKKQRRLLFRPPSFSSSAGRTSSWWATWRASAARSQTRRSASHRDEEGGRLGGRPRYTSRPTTHDRSFRT
jgi:hypothetical protein